MLCLQTQGVCAGSRPVSKSRSYCSIPEHELLERGVMHCWLSSDLLFSLGGCLRVSPIESCVLLVLAEFGGCLDICSSVQLAESVFHIVP